MRTVRAAYPQFIPSDDIDKFRLALMFVSSRGRLPAPNYKFYMATWYDDLDEFARLLFALRSELDLYLVAAVIAAADVPFQLPAMGSPMSIGLARFGGRRYDTQEIADGLGGTITVRTEPAFLGLIAGTRSLLRPTEAPPLRQGRSPTRVESAGRLWSSHEPWLPG
jgi:hypothetical protein